jgi:hypothetical protein
LAEDDSTALELVTGDNEITSMEDGNSSSVTNPIHNADGVFHGIASSMESDRQHLQDLGSGKYVSLRKFHLLARDHKDVFCFYRVLKGNDRSIFVKYLVPLVNERNFERHNLATGGISFKGWMEVLQLCAHELEHYYRIFEKQGGSLFYVTAIGHGPVADILLSSQHMTRVCVEGRYPMLDTRDWTELETRVVCGYSYSTCRSGSHDFAHFVEDHSNAAGADECEYAADD